MRGLFTTVQNLTFTAIKSARALVSNHFGNHLGGSLSGLFIRLPLTRFSAFIEWREVTVGFGHERSEGAVEVFAGRFQAVFSVEPMVAR